MHVWLQTLSNQLYEISSHSHVRTSLLGEIQSGTGFQSGWYVLKLFMRSYFSVMEGDRFISFSGNQASNTGNETAATHCSQPGLR